jgi:hypothetical protein
MDPSDRPIKGLGEASIRVADLGTMQRLFWSLSRTMKVFMRRNVGAL